MIEKRYRPAVAVLNNRIYVCGGECYDVFHDSIECFDCSINEWLISKYILVSIFTYYFML